MDGSFIGPELGGGFPFELIDMSGEIIKGKHIISPNITTDPETGVIAGWTQEDFISRCRSGRIIEGSPMHWGPFSRMTDDELVAVYKYLSNYEPVDRKIPYGIQTINLGL